MRKFKECSEDCGVVCCGSTPSEGTATLLPQYPVLFQGRVVVPSSALNCFFPHLWDIVCPFPGSPFPTSSNGTHFSRKWKGWHRKPWIRRWLTRVSSRTPNLAAKSRWDTATDAYTKPLIRSCHAQNPSPLSNEHCAFVPHLHSSTHSLKRWARNWIFYCLPFSVLEHFWPAWQIGSLEFSRR